MAKIEALIAGQRYVLHSDANEEAMQTVIAEVQERIEEQRQSAMTLGSREQVMLAFLNTVAELEALRNAPPEEHPELKAFISRLEYLEATLAFTETVAEVQKQSKSQAGRTKKPVRSKRKPKQRDFEETQIALKI